MNLENVIAERKNKVIYRDGDKCVKVFNHSFSKADILNEALNHARVEDCGLNVPKLLEVTTIDGKWAIVTEFIEGETLSHLMRDNPDDVKKYLEMMVDTQLLIHTKKSPLLSRLKDKMNRKILTADLDPVTRYELLIRLEEALPRRPLPVQHHPHPEGRAVCHRLGACHPGQRLRRRGPQLPDLPPARRGQSRRPLPRSLLREERY